MLDAQLVVVEKTFVLCCVLLAVREALILDPTVSLKMIYRPRPQVRRDYPLSLSISISGGKETYKDSLSNGERTGISPA
jgi:hypothetical protein